MKLWRNEAVHKKLKATTQVLDWNSYPMRLYKVGEKLF
jgi:hypothetical protein